MRIVSGTHKGRRITPDNKFSARPTTDFAKENIFNVLSHRVAFEGAMALDLFSGTGSISYELASRGAAEVVAVELNYNHYVFIKRTIQELGFKNILLYKNDVFAACRKLRGRQFDFIFADPPYDLPRMMEVPGAIFDNGLLKPGGTAVVEHGDRVDFSTYPGFLERREYGSVNFSLFTTP